jgi:hypothetical protein
MTETSPDSPTEPPVDPSAQQGRRGALNTRLVFAARAADIMLLVTALFILMGHIPFFWRAAAFAGEGLGQPTAAAYAILSSPFLFYILIWFLYYNCLRRDRVAVILAPVLVALFLGGKGALLLFQVLPALFYGPATMQGATLSWPLVAGFLCDFAVIARIALNSAFGTRKRVIWAALLALYYPLAFFYAMFGEKDPRWQVATASAGLMALGVNYAFTGHLIV